jgi:tRNA pseudouridine38-40 synthase
MSDADRHIDKTALDMRYFFEISYNGSAYSGWQSQHNATGIQTVVEDALSKMLREKIEIVASGRTDTGVHCEQQFFHADIQTDFTSAELLFRLNAFLPKDIVIHSIFPVKPQAHARYDAVSRSYTYRIVRNKNPFSHHLAWYFFRDLDVQTMNRAAALLLGNHDFQCFSKVNTDVNHFLCTIEKAEWQEIGGRLEFSITANRFLRGMVRAIVGTLLDVGMQRTTFEEFRAILESKDRKEAGANVPAHGLYLVKVSYPESIYLDHNKNVQ